MLAVDRAGRGRARAGQGRACADVLYDDGVSNEPEPRQPSPSSDGASPDRSSGDARRPAADDEPVPRLPRGRGLKLSFPEIARIVMIAAMLIAVMVLRRPCAESTGRFIESFEPPVDAGPARAPGQLPPGRYIPLTGEMTEQELRDRLELLEQIDAGAATSPAQPSEDSTHDRLHDFAPDRDGRSARDREQSGPAPASPAPARTPAPTPDRR